MNKNKWIPVFFAVAACSWMPHWACHYYRLETGSSFVVGSWEFTSMDSILSMLAYSALITLNLLAVAVGGIRMASALLSGLLHLVLAALHIFRLAEPFRFEVMGHPWPLGSSIREVIIVGLFGLTCLAVAWVVRRS